MNEECNNKFFLLKVGDFSKATLIKKGPTLFTAYYYIKINGKQGKNYNVIFEVTPRRKFIYLFDNNIAYIKGAAYEQFINIIAISEC